MRKVYMSFLGMGEYKSTLYHINGKDASRPYEYVQSAEMDIVLRDKTVQYDRFFIIMTEKSRSKHYSKLEHELLQLGVKEVTPVELSEGDDRTALDSSMQWDWFETILSQIEDGDELTVDLTHGYRIFSFVFSTAINFLQKSKNITLKSVWYGAFERDMNHPPIIDMKSFYIINDWADAVLRLTEDADAKGLGEVAKSDSVLDFQVGNLGDEKLVNALTDLTDAMRNVEINHVGTKASEVFTLIEKKENKATVTGKLLLRLVKNKFISLSTDGQFSGKYDLPYFELQLEIIKMLIKHKLYMQAYTVMREFIVSIGLIYIDTSVTSSKGRGHRKAYDFFINMFQYEEEKWEFNKTPEQKITFEKLKPFYDRLKQLGVEKILRRICLELVKYRNGFDHAWTANKEALNGIEINADVFVSELEKVIDILVKNELLK